MDEGKQLPDELETECTRVHGCQRTVYLAARQKPGTADELEFLADSDIDLVRGLTLLSRQAERPLARRHRHA